MISCSTVKARVLPGKQLRAEMPGTRIHPFMERLKTYMWTVSPSEPLHSDTEGDRVRWVLFRMFSRKWTGPVWLGGLVGFG